MDKVIIAGNIHPYAIEKMTEKGFKVINVPNVTYERLYNIIPDAIGIITTTRVVLDKAMLERAEKLLWIGRVGSGLDQIDLAYARFKKIRCINSPEGNRQAVAEHSLGLLLSLMHRIRNSSNEVNKGIWLRDENRGEELYGKTVGIIGFGNTGLAFAKLLEPFRVNVLAHDKYKLGLSNYYTKEALLKEVMYHSDIISFHLPLNGETLHFANQYFFSKLKKEPYILNCSRGKVIDTAALIQALKYGDIRGAGLDVLENEKIASLNSEEKEQFEWLNKQSNVILTPHIAGYSHEATFKMAQVLMKKLGFDSV